MRPAPRPDDLLAALARLLADLTEVDIRLPARDSFLLDLARADAPASSARVPAD